MTSPSLTIVMPVYNERETLRTALDRLLAVTMPIPTEVLVVDDGSSDGTVAVAEGFGAPVRVLRGAHLGPGAARSQALRLVEGDILMPFDADDLLTPASIECRLGVLSSRPRVDIVYGHVRRFAALTAEEPVALDQLQPSHMPNGMLIRRSAYGRVGPFASDLQVAEALDWLLRAREVGLEEVTVTDQVLWKRVHANNNSIVERGSFGEMAHVLKGSLDRRRAAQG